MPLNTTQYTVYTFDGVQFNRSNYSYGQDDWFPGDAITSKEPMIGGGTFRDTAGQTEGQFAIEAVFADYATQATMYGKRGKTSTLTKSFGGVTRNSGTYTLKSVGTSTLAPKVPSAKLVFE